MSRLWRRVDDIEQGGAVYWDRHPARARGAGAGVEGQAHRTGRERGDHLPLASEQHAVLLGDVTGKALPAALLAVKMQATVRALAPHLPHLGDLASGVNGILYRDGRPTRLWSLVYAVLTPNSGQGRMLIAGHMPPIPRPVRGDG